MGYIHAQHRQFVTVKVQKMFQGINEENFDGVIEEGEGEKFPIG
jgi:hypothetical protein